MFFHSFNSVGFRYYLFMSVLMLTMYTNKDDLALFIYNDMGLSVDISIVLVIVNITLLLLIPLIALVKDMLEDLQAIEGFFKFSGKMVDPYIQWKLEHEYRNILKK